jgi:SAM-dependent methyltransferase
MRFAWGVWSEVEAHGMREARGAHGARSAGQYDVWAAGGAYERYMGRWSRLVAERFVAWVGPAPGLRWLDVGCGTGALTSAVTTRCRPHLIVGVDRSWAFAEVAAAAMAPGSGATAVADAQALPFRDATFDAAAGGLVLNFLPEPAAALSEIVRTVRPGGLIGAYVWDYAEGMAFLRHFWDAASSVDPSAAPLDEGHRFPLCRPEPLRALWTDAGLDDVQVTPIEVPTHFGGFADLWEPFLAGQGPAAGYVAALHPESRDRVREALRASLATAPDGSIALTARAWGVKGRAPER